MLEIRLQKFLSQAGICSRRKAEQYITEGNVQVNGKTVRILGTKVDPENDHIQVFGKKASICSHLIYIALNKPRGIVTSCHHPGEKVVTDLVCLPQRIFPVGRLDKDSTGLLLLTNDGPLHQLISHPSFDHEKEYDVTVRSPVSDHDLQLMADGIILNQRKTRPAIVYRTGPNRFNIILKQGRNRQIRRMLSSLNHQVCALHRTRIEHVCIGHLNSGKWRYLTQKEVHGFQRMLKKQ
ncbi:MAG: rRNA pseudouridine synthase [Candidatus Magnetomorum sp.]|nr:rRNA pseudouridine synthase [Candidatus Magnetomorum sp.]